MLVGMLCAALKLPLLIVVSGESAMIAILWILND